MAVRAPGLPLARSRVPVSAPRVPPISGRLPPPLRAPIGAPIPAPLARSLPLLGPAGKIAGGLLIAGEIAGQLWGFFNSRGALQTLPFQAGTFQLPGPSVVGIEGIETSSNGPWFNCQSGEQALPGGSTTERPAQGMTGVWAYRLSPGTRTRTFGCGSPANNNPGPSDLGWEFLGQQGQTINGRMVARGGQAFGPNQIPGGVTTTLSITRVEVNGVNLAPPSQRDPVPVPPPVPAPAPLPSAPPAPAPRPLAPPAPAPLPGADPLPQPQPDGVPDEAPLAPPLAPPRPPIAPPGQAPAQPGTSPGQAPRPGVVPAPTAPTFPSQDPARPTQPIGPDGRPVPLLPPGPVTTPPGQVVVGPIVIGQPGATPRADLQGIATEVGRLEQKLEFMIQQPPEPPAVDLSPLLDAINDVRATLLAPFPAGQFELFPVCERLPDGTPRPPDVAEWPAGAGPLVELGQKLDALALLIQYHKEQRQPVCRSRPVGEEVTVNFVEVP